MSRAGLSYSVLYILAILVSPQTHIVLVTPEIQYEDYKDYILEITMKNIAINIILVLMAYLTVSTNSYADDPLKEQMQAQRSALKAFEGSPNLSAAKFAALEKSIALIKKRQQEKREENIACLEAEKNLPTDIETCFEVESTDDAQLSLLVLAVEQLVQAQQQ
ncbi:hypothetical protein Kalk_00960 [Ketobacter alkanivorans]|jgi:hypothetical protein|uniref:Uncharacterized protein n=2 Tax=Ketobacter alkanivorans TaxID=1917421 RepID=A0A2K9LFF3_9GAMM|nr:hypothetical protein Kalk_00960 [Ketobacter alkanivorans]|tara:strand:+ start:246 stop:734 length:489 start_codon:yes stop_codon:yes gene_type:complete